mmetsp:Transcript_647/g.1292  ORF Transcript_647/g.1292 Transcript_647/m.1292 type:complete len:98 (+) Transcript_647:363-656(+)
MNFSTMSRDSSSDTLGTSEGSRTPPMSLRRTSSAVTRSAASAPTIPSRPAAVERTVSQGMPVCKHGNDFRCKACQRAQTKPQTPKGHCFAGLGKLLM